MEGSQLCRLVNLAFDLLFCFLPSPHLNPRTYGDKNLAEENFACDVCVIAFRSNAKLQIHLKTSECIRKHHGTTKIAKGRGGGQSNIAKKRFWCETCQHNAPSAKRLDIHLNGPRHAKKLRLLAQRAQRA